jgi:TRAP-type C4-dicarboxylate transport system permease small subunit
MRAILDKVVTLWALAAGAVLLAIVLVTTVNVGAFALDAAARAFGGTVSALPGYEDFVRLSISSAALMFFPYCQRQQGHVAVDLFVDMLPRRLARILEGVWLLLPVGVALFLLYWMAFGMIEARADGTVAAVLGWPEWPFYAPGIASLALWAAVAGVGAVDALRGSRSDV